MTSLPRTAAMPMSPQRRPPQTSFPQQPLRLPEYGQFADHEIGNDR
jgi:hypothetical protein